MKEKLMSRKFWITAAAFLGSIGTSIAGLCTSNPTVAAVGTVCAMLSAAIYAACEAYVDAAAVNLGTDSATTITTTYPDGTVSTATYGSAESEEE